MWSRLYGETSAAFGTACVDNRTAARCFHTNAKTVGFFAAGYGWLIGAFHNRTQLKRKLGAHKRRENRLYERKLCAELGIILFFQSFSQPLPAFLAQHIATLHGLLRYVFGRPGCLALPCPSFFLPIENNLVFCSFCLWISCLGRRKIMGCVL